ncbi:MAG: hypothetical protein HY018_08775 [Hydrogenophilales bacterium]|nr:hypothetical protein [Hydrogenophilales bacterium]
MISDEDVRQYFKNKMNVPGVYGGAGSLQIGRGPLLLKGAPPGGCQRHKVVFNKFNVIPEFCFDCYKVLITPRTVMELFKLLMVFDGLELSGNNTRKCMVEGRADSEGSYKGFIYCRSIEEGKEVRRILQEIVAVEISPDVPVLLKRGCSEFARTHPRYAQIKPGKPIMPFPPSWKGHEDFVDKNYALEHNVAANSSNANPETKAKYPLSEIFALQYWLQYAATIGDISYLKIAGRVLPPIPQLKRPPLSLQPAKCK